MRSVDSLKKIALACFFLFTSFSYADEFPKYCAKSEEAICIQKCSEGHPIACSLLSQNAYSSGDEKKGKELGQQALSLKEESCNKGNVDACHDVGRAYVTGQYVFGYPKGGYPELVNEEKGIPILKKICESKKPLRLSCYELGQTYDRPDSYAEWKSRGGENGGNRQGGGRSVQKTTTDLKEALKFYKRSCRKNKIPAACEHVKLLPKEMKKQK